MLLKTSATIENIANKRGKRKEVVEPLTNYNVLVLDQRLDKTHLYHLSTQTQEMEL
jgi:U3 small nucleolar ribonucleoprotein component